MNKKALKKHHFWILSGLVPLIVLIAFLCIINGVGSAIETQTTAIKTAKENLTKKTDLKTDNLIAQLEKQKLELEQKKRDMWKLNWDKEKKEFTWPAQMTLANRSKDYLEGLNKLAFWDPISTADRDEYPSAKVYPYDYIQMAASVAPTQFWGEAPGEPGWKKVLRHVSDWGEKRPESASVWLALEDTWVQRSLLRAVKTVNDQMATFTTPKTDPSAGTPVPHYKCQSRLWDVELWVERRGSENIMRGKLKNLTDRLQILGVGNTMRLLVWMDNKDLNDESLAVEFLIEGEFVKANSFAQATEKDPAPIIKEIPRHTIIAGKTIGPIYKVKQKFDVRTVPIRRIDQIALNYRDSRHFTSQLVPFFGDKPSAAAASGDSMSGDTPKPMGTTNQPAAAAIYGGGGPVEAVVGGTNRSQRYLVSTQEVRRLPLGMVIVLDQMYIQDFLVALANIPLPFQTTQVHWQRFRGTLPTGTLGGAAPASGGGESVVQTAEGGVTGSGFGPADDPYNRGIGRTPVRPGGPAALGPGGSLSNVSEAQLTAGLVNLSVYGIVSLYSKVPDTAPETKASN